MEKRPNQPDEGATGLPTRSVGGGAPFRNCHGCAWCGDRIEELNGLCSGCATKRSWELGPPVTPDCRTYSVDEAAVVMGVGRTAMFDAVRRGEVPGVVRIGKRIVISKARLHAWIDGTDEPCNEE